MRANRWVRCPVLLVWLAAIPFAVAVAAAQERESIFERVVRIESTVITEIPETPRWEEQLDLTVRRVDVGDAELYVEEEGSGVPLVLINGGPGGTHHYFHGSAEPGITRASSTTTSAARDCPITSPDPTATPSSRRWKISMRCERRSE
jgi:hypothetical protein